jgi:hypothetical protein
VAAANPPSPSEGDPHAEGEGGLEEEDMAASGDFQAVDKTKWEEILSQLDPDDFKYKM